MRVTLASNAAFAIAAALLSSCTDQAQIMGPQVTRADGAEFFAENCTACHGAEGRGSDRPANSHVASAPDLTTLSDRNGGGFPQARALTYIYGDPNDNHLTRVMPEFGGAMAEDLVLVEIEGVVTPTPRELAGLLFYLESIQR